MTDPILVQAQQGDPKALEALLLRLAPTVHRFGLRMCKNEHDADDVLQDTLLLIATRLADFEGRASLSSWVFALARSACSRRRRGLANQPPVDDATLSDTPTDGATPEDLTSNRQLGEAISQALHALPEEYREVLVLRDVEGLTAPEVADALSLSVDAVKSRLHRARASLRKRLQPLLEPAAPPPTPACPDVADMLSRKLEGDLTSLDCAAMEKHLASCPRCSSACNAVRAALSACRASTAPTLTPAERAQVSAVLTTWLAERRSSEGVGGAT